MVGRERAHHDASAAKRDERAAVAGERVDEIRYIGLGALETVWANILGKHRARDVNRYHDVTRARHRLFHRLSPLRPRRGKKREEKPRDDACSLKSGD